MTNMEKKLSVIDEHENDYNRRLERYQFTDGLSHDELIKKVNTRKSRD